MEHPRTLVIHDMRFRDRRSVPHVTVGQVVTGTFDRVIVAKRLGPVGRRWFARHVMPCLAPGFRVTWIARWSPLPRN